MGQGREGGLQCPLAPSLWPKKSTGCRLPPCLWIAPKNSFPKRPCGLGPITEAVLPEIKQKTCEMQAEGMALTGHPGLPLEPAPNLAPPKPSATPGTVPVFPADGEIERRVA